MHFNCPLAYFQFRGDLFVQETGRDQCENFALASGQRAEASFDLETLGMLPTPRTRALNPLLDRSQQRFVVERLLEDIHSACPHRVHSYRHIAAPGDENDRHEIAARPELI